MTKTMEPSGPSALWQERSLRSFDGNGDASLSFVFASANARGGTPEPDKLRGTVGDDQLNGGRGDDVLKGLAGDDILFGGGGDDRLVGGPGFDELHGGRGDDVLVFSGDGHAFGDDGDDVIRGGATVSDSAELSGGDGDDRLFSGLGGATLDGGPGDDVLTSGAGRDSLIGGEGVDRFVFGETWGGSLIQDFHDGVEKIDLRGLGLAFADLTISGSDGLTIISSSHGTIALTLSPAQLTAADFLFG